ncbi:hypothetical protein C8A03DRAFT_32953 [Achaetomium macrosporum]|uniref:C2H2-type domain-containing protein n=1 Tax=Achaetomium macrosporum TaxID=79813 RepID=A0AAN7HEL7_9PEZI|nr:hypothetical protein C8A03DRAFT_32953 [Achaetomium macrosporum]
MEPVSPDSGGSYKTPLGPRALPSAAESPVSDQDSDSFSSTSSSSTRSSSPSSRPKEYRCTFPNCKSKVKVFNLACKLRPLHQILEQTDRETDQQQLTISCLFGPNRKHMKNHSRPHKCPYCNVYRGGAERKDLARHVHKFHPDMARRDDRTYSKEFVPCPRCDVKNMRADNLKRHLRTCGGTGTGNSVGVLLG